MYFRFCGWRHFHIMTHSHINTEITHQRTSKCICILFIMFRKVRQVAAPGRSLMCLLLPYCLCNVADDPHLHQQHYVSEISYFNGGKWRWLNGYQSSCSTVFVIYLLSRVYCYVQHFDSILVVFFILQWKYFIPCVLVLLTLIKHYVGSTEAFIEHVWRVWSISPSAINDILVNAFRIHRNLLQVSYVFVSLFSNNKTNDVNGRQTHSITICNERQSWRLEAHIPGTTLYTNVTWTPPPRMVIDIYS